MVQSAGILFTAFEPSGDAVAAPVIAALREMEPKIPIWALGGPKMEQAGAELLTNTVEHAAMGLGAVGLARRHRRTLKQLKRWLKDHELKAFVPVDSPAANFPICKIIRGRLDQTRIVHLVAPQLWAWGAWRIVKLRRLTDHVMCVLPFEPGWFIQRQVRATFVGHPLTDPASMAQRLRQADNTLPQGLPKLALLPGSRQSEVLHNLPTMLRVATRLRDEHRKLTVTIAAADEKAVKTIEHMTRKKNLPPWVTIRVGQTDAVLKWCDLALVVSGTATLQTATHLKPMAVLYHVNFWSWNLVGRWLIKSRAFALPNIVGQTMGVGSFVPEYVPHRGRVEPIARELHELITSADHRNSQVASLRRVVESFGQQPYGVTAAARVMTQIRHPGAA